MRRTSLAIADVLSLSAFSDATKGNFVVPRTCLKLGGRAFSVPATQTWNQLLTELITPLFEQLENFPLLAYNT